MQQDTTLIRNFKQLPQASLVQLKQSLGLRMSVPELVFCATHFQGNPTGEISTQELRFIDALACPAHIDPAKIAAGEICLARREYAQSLADAIAKLKELGRDPEKPFTLKDFADLPARYLAALPGNQVFDEPIGIGGSDTAYAAKGLATATRLESAVGHFDILQELISGLDAHAAYTDTLLLLSPGEQMDTAAFGAATVPLLRGSEVRTQIHCICDCSTQSPAHAVLRVSNGAILNLARLPLELQSAQALTECCTALLLALPQEAAWKLQEEAAAYQLDACCFGVADHAGYLILRNQKEALFSLDVSYLKSICFIRSYTLRLHDTAEADRALCPQELPLHTPADLVEEQAPTEQLPQRTHKAIFAPQTSYHASLQCATRAYCAAVAAGCDPQRIALHVRLAQNGKRSAAASAMLSALLGLHRFAMETRVATHTEVAFDDQSCGITMLASAPSDPAIPSHLQGNGRIYLLQPACDEEGIPDFEELRAMLAYLRRAMQDGRIRSARAFGKISVPQALKQMQADRIGVIPNPYATLHKSPAALFLLVEATDAIQGDLIGVSCPENLDNSL